VSGAVYTGLDVVARDLTVRQGARTRFVLGDGGALPFADDSFDVVFCAYVLDRVGDAQDALAECAPLCSI
jgi:ubiquinone/menaquinone biosynthesis C-methylase UbiE